MDDRGDNNQFRKITNYIHLSIDQWIRRNNEATTQEILEKLKVHQDINVSESTVQRELHWMGCRNIWLWTTYMLIQKQKEKRVQCIIERMNDRGSPKSILQRIIIPTISKYK